MRIIGINFYLCGEIDNMQQSSAVSRIQLARFRTKEPSLSVERAVYISDGYTFPTDLPFPFKLSFTAAVICLEGELRLAVNQRSLTMTRGDIAIIQQGSIMESLWNSPEGETISMAFPETDEEWLFSWQADKLGVWLAHRSVPLLIHHDEIQLRRYLDLYALVKALYRDAADAMKDEIVKGFLSISVASFLSSPQMSLHESQTKESESRKEEIFLRFMDDLQLYGGRERSVQFYSDRLCISAKHFSKLVRQASGRLPMTHIRQRVIIEAKTLLRTTDMTVSEIADALNFPNDSFFCRYFKHDTGLSPSEYRNS